MITLERSTKFQQRGADGEHPVMFRTTAKKPAIISKEVEVENRIPE